MSLKMRSSKTGNAALSIEHPSYPMENPPMPRKTNYFVTCCSVILILAALPLYTAGYSAISILAVCLLCVLVLTVGACLVLPLTGVLLYFKSWWFEGYNFCCIPKESYADIYSKILFLIFQNGLVGGPVPTSKNFKIDELRPRQFLQKNKLAYALNLSVPLPGENEFGPQKSSIRLFFEENLSRLPLYEHFQPFVFGEDPVEFVMANLGNVFPEMHQIWDDKQSDAALVRFCKVGLAAARIESILDPPDKTVAQGAQVKYYVFRTSQLALLEVKDGYARYGSDVFFDAEWNVVMIEDTAFGKPARDNLDVKYSSITTFRPGDLGWEAAKFRFRSAMFTLVTIVDHLYGIHLQVSNLLVTAVRENMDADHPVRRFITPYTYETIGVNSRARMNLVAPRAMANRCFAFSDTGTRLAWAGAPELLMGGAEILKAVRASERADIGTIKNSLNRRRYIENYLKRDRGIETPYYYWNEKYWDVTKKFIVDYCKVYYNGDIKNMAQDRQVIDTIVQFLDQAEFSSSADLGRNFNAAKIPDVILAEMLIETLASYMCLVTSGHEHVGSVAPYAQDVSWCAPKWVPGASIGTKNAALNIGLLISFTSTPMPRLMKPLPEDEDPYPWEPWTHLFPNPKKRWRSYQGPCGDHPEITATVVFDAYQSELQDLARAMDKYNDENPLEAVYCFNPKYLDTSVSV